MSGCVEEFKKSSAEEKIFKLGWVWEKSPGREVEEGIPGPTTLCLKKQSLTYLSWTVSPQNPIGKVPTSQDLKMYCISKSDL